MAKKKRIELAGMDSIEYTRSLVRKAWAEMGIAEPTDSVTYARGLVEKGLNALADRHEPSD